MFFQVESGTFAANPDGTVVRLVGMEHEICRARIAFDIATSLEFSKEWPPPIPPRRPSVQALIFNPGKPLPIPERKWA